MKIGILSDTHLPSGALSHLGELGSAVADTFANVDLVLHSGDVNLPSVLDWCEQFAEVRCSAGGHDHFLDDRCANVQILEHAGWRIGMVHDVEAIPPNIDTPHELAERVYGDAALDVLIAGDSHYERLEMRDGKLLLDSGSPCFPHHRSTRLGSVALLEIERDYLRAEIVHLGDTPGAKNPCTPAHLLLERGGRVIEASLDGAPVEEVRWRPHGAPPLRV